MGPVYWSAARFLNGASVVSAAPLSDRMSLAAPSKTALVRAFERPQTIPGALSFGRRCSRALTPVARADRTRPKAPRSRVEIKAGPP